MDLAVLILRVDVILAGFVVGTAYNVQTLPVLLRDDLRGIILRVVSRKLQTYIASCSCYYFFQLRYINCISIVITCSKTRYPTRNSISYVSITIILNITDRNIITGWYPNIITFIYNRFCICARVISTITTRCSRIRTIS